MPKHYTSKTQVGRYRITGIEPKFVYEFSKRNWWLIAVYSVVTVGGIAASYFTQKWTSVAVSTVVAVVTFFVGLRMIQWVIRER